MYAIELNELVNNFFKDYEVWYIKDHREWIKKRKKEEKELQK